jgi:hypothetical protein
MQINPHVPSPPDRTNGFYARYSFQIWFLIVLILVVAIVEVTTLVKYSHSFFAQHPYPLLSMLLGIFVGAAEIISRYRDEPFGATFSPPGIVYLALNGTIAAAAYGFLINYKGAIFPGLTDPLLVSIVAGFGAMIVMRSKLFNFKTEGGEDFAIGPDAVISTFLSSVDRKIDRFRSSLRQEVVYEETVKIVNPMNASGFFRTSIASYQNLSDAEKGELDSLVKEVLANNELGPRLKLMAIGFGFLNIYGEKNYKALMDQLKKYQSQFPDDKQPPPDANASTSTTDSNPQE